MAQDGVSHRVLYSGGTHDEAANMLAAHFGVQGDFTFVPLADAPFPGEHGLWAVGARDAWACTETATADRVQARLDDATDALFNLQYEEAIAQINAAMGHLACAPVHSLIGRAMFLRGMVACMSGARVGDRIYGDAARTLDFFLYAAAADPAVAWDASFPPTCEVLEHGVPDDFDAAENFAFAKEAAVERRDDRALWTPAETYLDDLDIALASRDAVPTPSMVDLQWQTDGRAHRRIIMLDMHERLVLVSHAGWQGLLREGPDASDTHARVIRLSFEGESASVVDVLTMAPNGSAELYAFYPAAEQMPFHAYAPYRPESPPASVVAPKSMVGFGGMYSLVAHSSFAGPSVFAHVRLHGGLMLHVGAGVGFTEFDDTLWVLPAAELGLRYRVRGRRAEPFFGGHALVTFTNDPARSPVHIAGLGCGGIALHPADHLIAPFVEACGGGGTLQGVARFSLGVAFY